MADGELAGADPASNYGGSQVWLFANLMYRLNRILQELHLPSRSAVMLASRPADDRPSSIRPSSTLLPGSIGPELIPLPILAVLKLHVQETMAVRRLVLYFMLYCMREARSAQCLT